MKFRRFEPIHTKNNFFNMKKYMYVRKDLFFNIGISYENLSIILTEKSRRRIKMGLSCSEIEN